MKEYEMLFNYKNKSYGLDLLWKMFVKGNVPQHAFVPLPSFYKCCSSCRRKETTCDYFLRCRRLLVRKNSQSRKCFLVSQTTSTKYSFPSFQPSKKGSLSILFFSTAVFLLVYGYLSRKSRTFALFHGILCAGCTWGVGWLVAANLSYSRSLVASPEEVVEDFSSQFIRIQDTTIHFKQYIPQTRDTSSTATKTRWGLILLHGFGSWLYTYHALWEPEKRQPFKDCALVGFDRPAFGFTSKPRDKKYYTQCFAMYLVHVFMEKLSFQGISHQVLVGHSMGGLTAALAALKYPQHVKALILIAAAIPTDGTSSSLLSNNHTKIGSSMDSSAIGKNPRNRIVVLFTSRFFQWFWLSIVTSLFRIVGNACSRIFYKLAYVLLSPVMYLVLSVMVSQETFWKRGLSFAWYSKQKLVDKVVEQYRLPSLVRHWQRGLIDFVFANTTSRAAILSKAQEDIVDQLCKMNIPILLIHGKEDRIIPLERSMQLAARIPQARLVVIPQCGHVPQEEQPQQVVDEIKQFLSFIENARVVPTYPESSL